ncbi:hypothetical protein CRUP_007459 [Coryphaenoides rupestris]|nr:hypothetical protein CRUP_007459 [Coryphaenoides rupestris]
MGYCQGMSDLVAPLLTEVRDESDTFWCFVGLMENTIFISSPRDEDMERQLVLTGGVRMYLRELLRLMLPRFHQHLTQLGEDGLQLLFCHRWVLLCFKREFPDNDALRMWEACWAHYQKRLLRSVLTTSLSTVNWTFLQNSLCSSGVMDNLHRAPDPRPRTQTQSNTHTEETRVPDPRTQTPGPRPRGQQGPQAIASTAGKEGPDLPTDGRVDTTEEDGLEEERRGEDGGGEERRRGEERRGERGEEGGGGEKRRGEGGEGGRRRGGGGEERTGEERTRGEKMNVHYPTGGKTSASLSRAGVVEVEDLVLALRLAITSCPLGARLPTDLKKSRRDLMWPRSTPEHATQLLQSQHLLLLLPAHALRLTAALGGGVAVQAGGGAYRGGHGLVAHLPGNKNKNRGVRVLEEEEEEEERPDSQAGRTAVEEDEEFGGGGLCTGSTGCQTEPPLSQSASLTGDRQKGEEKVSESEPMVLSRLTSSDSSSPSSPAPRDEACWWCWCWCWGGEGSPPPPSAGCFWLSGVVPATPAPVVGTLVMFLSSSTTPSSSWAAGGREASSSCRWMRELGTQVRMRVVPRLSSFSTCTHR